MNIVSSSFLGCEVAVPRIKPPFNYIGSKVICTPWILSHTPTHASWLDAFGGSLAVTLGKKPSNIETVTDLDGNLIAFYRTLRNPETFHDLLHRMTFSISSREEFEEVCRKLSVGEWKDEVERAWMFWYKSVCGIPAAIEPVWKRRKSIDVIKTNRLYSGIPDNDRDFDMLLRVHNRLRKVQIESKDALEVILELDSPRTCVYADPPYDPRLRTSKLYAVDQDVGFHQKLVDVLLALKGSCVLSGYREEKNNLYHPLEKDGWKVFSRVGARVGKGDPGTEYIWVKR